MPVYKSRIRSFLFFMFLFAQFILYQNCAPVFSEMQSARLVGEDNHELTAGYTSVSVSDNDDSEALQEELGLQYAYGLSDHMDLRLRYEHISLENGDFNFNVIGFGPKFRITEDVAAFYLPVGFAFGEDIEVSDTWQIHPTFLFTVPLGKNFELNPSGKALIPVGNDGDILVAFNLGAGFSTDFSKWAIRPEFGYMFNPGEQGHFTQFSIAISIATH
jgi:hypothetical protein